MAKLTRIIRSKDPVSETEANAVFEILIPIVEAAPSSAAAETAEDVIGRISLEEDRHLTPVLDWWYVATTGRSSANGGAHRLPKSIDRTVRTQMESVVKLGVSIPPTEWLDKRRRLESMLERLGEALDNYGTTKPGEREVWLSFCRQLNGTVTQLRGNRRAIRAEIEPATVAEELLDRGFDAGSRPYRRMQKRCREALEHVNKVVDLQGEVEPWIPRPRLGLIDTVPSDFKHAVGPLAEDLLRPILAANAAPTVDRARVAESIDAAARRGDRRGRYKLARIVEAWCEETGVSIGSLEEELKRHRDVESVLNELESRGRVSSNEIDEVRIHILDDDIDEAEKALAGLRERMERQERAERARHQHVGLRRKLLDSTLREDVAWIERVAEIEGRLDSADPREMAREIGAAQTELSAQLDGMLHEAQEDLKHLLEPLSDLGAADSLIRGWDRRIDELESRSGRGANELKQEIEKELKQLRNECRSGLDQTLENVDRSLAEEREEFRVDDIGYLVSLHSEIEVECRERDLTDSRLFDARQRAARLWEELQDRRIHRWRAADGEQELVDHLVNFCTGPLDFDSLDIRRLYVSLKTRPFVILAGLTGSGKSSLSRTFAAAFGANGANRRFRRIAVKPDWIDQTDVLGFVNPISESFVPGWLAETVRDCELEPNRLHFVLLDEMNLAPVEQYLAEWLSAIEEARSGSEDVQLPLYSSALNPKNGDEWPHSLGFPDNLIIIGTVNVDETTRPLSERVLDRANVLLLNVEVSARHHEPTAQAPRPWHVGVDEWSKVCSTEPSDDHHLFLVEIADILRQAGVGVGLRAHIELERFVTNAKGVLDEESALDWGIVQRIIPKIRGFKGQIAESLNELFKEFEGVGAPQSAEIVRRWLDASVSDDEFLEGTDPRLALVRV